MTEPAPQPPRHLVVVDVETNGLDPVKHVAVEVAWWNLHTDQRGLFIPQHDVDEVLAAAEPRALEVNGYRDRIAGAPQDDGTAVRELYAQLRGVLEPEDPPAPPRWRGNTLTGANPTFDASMLAGLFGRTAYGVLFGSVLPPGPLPLQPWHHRLWDVSAYAAGVFGLEELPSLSDVCRLVDVDPGGHRAESDVTATGLCLRVLRALARVRVGVAP